MRTRPYPRISTRVKPIVEMDRLTRFIFIGERGRDKRTDLWENANAANETLQSIPDELSSRERRNFSQTALPLLSCLLRSIPERFLVALSQ